jgi:glycosyltransferase involved in cell wall biosynthesis
VRILHLVAYPLYSGPLPQTLGLALAQRRLGHRVWLAFDRKRGAFNQFEEAAAPHLEGTGLDPPARLTLSTKSSPLEYLRDLTALRKLVRSGEVDVVHVHLSHDHGLASLAGPGRAARVRTFHADRSLVRRFGQALLNRRADAWIVRCAEHRRLLLERFAVSEERTRVIPGSIDAERFVPADDDARAAARRRFEIPEDVPVLGQVALIAGRGQEELVDAVASLGDAAPFLLFVGRGEREEAVRARVQAAGLDERVRFSGYLEGDELLGAYAAMDAAFVAQPGNDASARAALEAMASGVPVLAVQTGALAELVDADHGFPVAARTPSDIAATVRAWLDDRKGAAERAARARERVLAERTVEHEAEQTLALYQRVAGNA